MIRSRRVHQAIVFRRTGAHLLGVLALAVAAIAVVGSAQLSAQTGPSATCTGEQTTTFGSDLFGPGERGVALLSSAPQTREFALAAPIPAGTWTVNAVSYDGYPDRETVEAQPFEQWYAELLAADGAVLATTGPTADLEDGVVESTWAGSLGEVSLTAEAVGVRVVHTAPGHPSPNSVRPSCIGASAVVESVPSTVTVTFLDEGGTPGTIGVACDTRSESASGATATIGLDALEPGTVCDSTYPMDRGCTVAISPAGIENAVVDDVRRVTIPAEGGVDVIIDIVCPTGGGDPIDDPGVDPIDDTGGDPVDSSQTPDDVTTVVGGQVETPADAAVPQPGTPAFTG